MSEETPLLPWMLLVPIVAIMIFEIKEAALWSLYSALSTVGLLYLNLLYQFAPNEYIGKLKINAAMTIQFTGPLSIFLLFGYVWLQKEQFSKLLIKKNHDLEELKQEKEKLLSVLFHDLGRNTSLLSGYLEMSKHKDLTGEDKAKIYRHTEEIKTILINAKKLDTLQLNNEALQVNIFVIFNDLKLLFSNQLIEKKLTFIFEGDQNQTILINPSHFKSHILGNLISNAIKFAEKESIISLIISKNSISLENQGMAFSEEKKSGTNGEKGDGIGLDIVKDYCKKNNLVFSIETNHQNITKAKILY